MNTCLLLVAVSDNLFQSIGADCYGNEEQHYTHGFYVSEVEP